MAVCEFCKQEMLTAKGCTFTKIGYSKGKKYKRIKYGDEGWFDNLERCGDCGAMLGGYHHYGCDVERCPNCGDQLIACMCGFDTLFK